jgi:hypothetical protein
MKFFNIGIALLFFAPFTTNASEEFKSFAEYQIIKDSINPEVHKDSCLIIGLVKDYNGILIKGAVVNTVDLQYKSTTDGTGRFSLMIAKKRTNIFFFKPKFNEIITQNLDFKGGHEVEIHFTALSDDFQLIMDKPVVYLYSNKPLNARVIVKPKGSFLFTYPKYNSGWNVELDGKDHLLVNGKEYPYLFWEAQTKEISILKENEVVLGEIVKQNEVVTFLENKLREIGFNAREQTDFITYWAPRMLKEESYLVQFVIDEAYEKNIASMKITPKPDVMKRVFMLFQKAELGMKPKKQEFTPIMRKGFTVIEWGGTELPEGYITFIK